MLFYYRYLTVPYQHHILKLSPLSTNLKYKLLYEKFVIAVKHSVLAITFVMHKKKLLNIVVK